MPIPFLVAAAAVAIGGFGVKKGIDARQDNDIAQDYYDRAEDVFDEAQRRLNASREETLRTLENLGKLKLQIWKRQFSRYVELMEQIHHVELPAPPGSQQISAIHIDKQELAEMETLSLKAGEVLGVGTAALGSGALAGVACYGGAMTFASASTGTAIASLSGAAATNATLAWFGGGSLAAGGMGIAGGTAVLGGVVAAPVIAVAGMVMASKARENLANARRNYSQAKVAAEEMDSAASKVNAINNVAKEFNYLVNKIDWKMTAYLKNLESILAKQKGQWSNSENTIDYRNFDGNEKKVVHENYVLAQIMKKVLETSILKKDGSLINDYSLALEEGNKILATL